MMGADFLWHWIVPLQMRDPRSWPYQNIAHTMRLHPGLFNNLTVLQHALLFKGLFNKGAPEKLPENVIPLCNNTAKDSILAMMPTCTTQGMESTWEQPNQATVDEWFTKLAETPIRVEDDLVHDTKKHELELISRRAEEARGLELLDATCDGSNEEEE